MLGAVASICLYIFVNDIIATIITGIGLLVVVISHMIITSIIFASKTKSVREFLFSQKMLKNLLLIGMMVTVGYLGRFDLMDYPLFFKKEFQTYTGVPEEIDFYKGSGKGPGSRTKFKIDSGEVFLYHGILRDLNPDHEYKIVYLPNSKYIVNITDLDTGQKWEHR
jgi:hypothetical protein